MFTYTHTSRTLLLVNQKVFAFKDNLRANKPVSSLGGARHRKNHLARAYPFFTLTISGQVEFITQMWIFVPPKFPSSAVGVCSRRRLICSRYKWRGDFSTFMCAHLLFSRSLRPIIFRPCTFESMSYKKKPISPQLFHSFLLPPRRCIYVGGVC